MDTHIPPDPGADDGEDPDGAGIAVEVSDTQSHLKVDHEAVARLVRGALRAEGVARASVSVALVDDAAIHEINRRHLGHDWPTDVISFPLSDPGDPALAGELVVSAETAASTARQAGVSARDELALYLVHGLLHLCGHDDSTAGDRDAMRRREGEILAHLGLTNTFPAAAPAGAEDGGRERARWTV
jgi:probable rRNA maturation factor